MFSGHTPVITQAQLVAVLGWIVAQAVAFGWVDNDQAQVLLSSGATVVAVAWKLADAFLRGKRAEAVGRGATLD